MTVVYILVAQVGHPLDDGLRVGTLAGFGFASGSGEDGTAEGSFAGPVDLVSMPANKWYRIRAYSHSVSQP